MHGLPTSNIILIILAQIVYADYFSQYRVKLSLGTPNSY